ncbi:hypothetical protein, partial [Klebsiella pneumoniae]
EEGSLAVTPRFFAIARQAHEALFDLFDEIAAGQDPTARPDCLAALHGLLDDALDPAALGLVGAAGATTLPVAGQLPDPAVVD